MTPKLHTVEHGTGTPIIFIHGFTVDHRLLLPLESTFDRRLGWRRIYIDLPGHGLSASDGFAPSAEAIADTVATTIRDAVGEENFALCGNSFGGQMARAMLPRFGAQVMGLALIAPVVGAREKRRRSTHRIFGPAAPAFELGQDNVDLVAEYRATAVELTKDSWDRFNDYVAPGLTAHNKDFAALLREDYDLGDQPESLIGTFDGPSLVITGRQDDGVGFEDQFELLKDYPRMTFVALDKAGHNVHLDQRTVSNALFEEWLDRMRS